MSNGSSDQQDRLAKVLDKTNSMLLQIFLLHFYEDMVATSQKHRLIDFDKLVGGQLQYFPDTDTLYIRLTDTKIENTDMINDNLIIDFDAEEKVVGITIEYASTATDLSIAGCLQNYPCCGDSSTIDDS